MEFKTLSVNGSDYKVMSLSPDKAMDLMTEASITFAPVLSAIKFADDDAVENFLWQIAGNIGKLDADRIKRLFNEIRQYVVLPDGRYMNSPVAFQEWFSVHKQDLFIVQVKSIGVLLKDFFPNVADILKGVKI